MRITDAILKKNLLRRSFLSKLLGILPIGLLPSFISEKKIDLLELSGKIQPQLCGEGFLLRNIAAEAFHEMQYEASKEGVHIWCSSGYRSFIQQAGIWKSKYLKLKADQYEPQQILEKITEFTAIPGTSRHHWGTEIDLVDSWGTVNDDPLNVPNYYQGGSYQYLGYWLEQHATRFGFYQTYTNDPQRTGFKHEPWHFSYAEEAVDYLKILLETDLKPLTISEAVPLSNYFDTGFLEKYKQQYMLGINPKLIPS